MNKNCTVYKTVDFIGKRWTLLILLEMYKGVNHKKRYNVLKNSLPHITSKMLSARLKELQKRGLLKKKVDSTTAPITSEYQLTKKGVGFINIIKDIKGWALNWDLKNKKCESQDCDKCEF
ncbi:helix-turn-helix transcriptional regulator [Candidatus Woesearchaeota archaeon]|nr:helix-turn-helix transcriptional regulator [Candidatus Woesearchaeota archaeon]